MLFKTYFWVEDHKDKAGYIFWVNLMKFLCPEVIVESKKNNSELVKSVKTLKDADNRYVIVFDNSFDNPQVVMEMKLLKHCAREKKNVILVDIICFEYILLEFKDLIKWIYAPEDEFLEKRGNIIIAREKFVNAVNSGIMDYKDIQEVAEYDKHIQEHNVEQLAAKMLFELTRNTGFEVSKGTIGDCWIKSCCERQGREADDICGLDEKRMLVCDKMKSIYEGTSLRKQFPQAGLEACL